MDLSNQKLSRMKTAIVNFFIICIIFISCNRQTLKFFFDGVDVENDKNETTSDVSINEKSENESNPVTGDSIRVEAYLSIHPAYKKKSCVECHNADYSHRLSQKQPDLCYRCHKKFQDSYNFLHGPVAAGLCTACHSPHRSKNEKLLKMPMRQSCQYCHHPGDINKNRAHEKTSHISCLECHHPHGGDTQNLLKQ